MVFSLDIKVRHLPITVRFPWKIGIVSFMACPSLMRGEGDVAGELLRIADDPFFDAVEICAVTGDQWGKVKGDVSRLAVGRGFQPDILSGKINLNSLDDSERKQAVEKLKEEIRKLGERGIKVVAVCSGPDPGERQRRAATQRLVDSLNELCEEALRLGVTVLLEAFDRIYDKKLLIGPIDEAAEVIRAVRKNHENIGLMWDLSHAPMLSENPSDLRRARDVLSHVHIGCAMKKGKTMLDTHPVFHSDGAVNTERDVAELLKVLLDVGYSAVVSFEVKPGEGQTTEEAIEMSKKVLKDAFEITVFEVLRGK